ncbi:hypothetical protein HC766_05165 [Candidatus Gracilibacteria bacterium]|nr:hypothetical protein [Candidatus Gracilibacteria bacterium]NJS41700.1 hypothetical protein [Candidatus Gracilibacteria bacterium]
MQEFYHDGFQVSGYLVNIPNQALAQEIIQKAWHKCMKEGLIRQIENVDNPSVHAVYYNYKKLANGDFGYDMLIGYATKIGSVQSKAEFVDISIPEQNYMYKEISGDFQSILKTEWDSINSLPKSELNRSYGYDLEMYSEDYKTCTIAVAVIK